MYESYQIIFTFYVEGGHNIEVCGKNTRISLILADI